MRYRIVEKTDMTGEVCFFPQHKRFFVWLNFMEMEVFPKVIKFYSLESATKFIKNQLNKPKEKIHFIK
jgi:hypothetical protein